MATITNRKMICDLIESNGYHSDDPQVQTIWTYRNAHNQEIMWAVYYHQGDVPDGPFVLNPVLLWGSNQGITHDGEWFISAPK